MRRKNKSSVCMTRTSQQECSGILEFNGGCGTEDMSPSV